MSSLRLILGVKLLMSFVSPCVIHTVIITPFDGSLYSSHYMFLDIFSNLDLNSLSLTIYMQLLQ